MHKPRSKWFSVVLLLAATLVWGFAFVVQAKARELPPFTFTAVRSFVGAAALFPLSLALVRRDARQGRATDRKALLGGGALCGLFLSLATSLQQIGINHSGAGKAGFITVLYIVIVPVAGLLFGWKARWPVWISVGLAAGGFCLLSLSGGGGISLGDLLVFLSAIAFSAQILTVSHVIGRVNGVALSCVQFLVCGVLSGLCAVFTEQPTLDSLSGGWPLILYMGLLSSGLAYTLQIIAQRDLDPTLASLLMSLESVFAALFGALFLGERLSLREWLGGALVFAAVVLSQLSDRITGPKRNS